MRGERVLAAVPVEERGQGRAMRGLQPHAVHAVVAAAGEEDLLGKVDGEGGDVAREDERVEERARGELPDLGGAVLRGGEHPGPRAAAADVRVGDGEAVLGPRVKGGGGGAVGGGEHVARAPGAGDGVVATGDEMAAVVAKADHADGAVMRADDGAQKEPRGQLPHAHLARGRAHKT